MHRFKLSAVAVVVALVLAACGSSSEDEGPDSAKGSGGEAEDITFSLASANFVSGLAWVWVGSHDSVGFYQEENVNPTFVGSNGAADCTQSLVAKRVDVCMLIQDPVLNRAAETGDKLPVKFVYNYTYKVTNEIGVKPDSSAASIEDLAGKRIGVNALAHDTYNFAQRAFQAAGLDPDAQEYIAVGQGAPAITALYQNRVDALVAYDIEWAIYDSIGQPVKVLPQVPAIAEVKGGPILAVRAEDVENRRDLIVRFMRALAKSTLFSITNPAATLQLHWDMYPESRPKEEVTPEVMKGQLAIVSARLPAIDKRRFDYVDSWGEFNEEGWEAYVTNILRHDVPDDVDPKEFYTNELIPDINDFDEEEVIKKAEDFPLDPEFQAAGG